MTRETPGFSVTRETLDPVLAFCACETLKGLMTRETPGSHDS